MRKKYIILVFEKDVCDYIKGLGEIGHEDPNFKIKTCAVGF